jgi:uncharacterized protein YndB with AHSA1/START domain
MKTSYTFSNSSYDRPGRFAVRSNGGDPASTSLTFSLESSLAADTLRVFHALTVPEYLETWLCVPGHHPECRNLMHRAGHEFQIEHSCNSGASIRIAGAYGSLLKRKLRFTWQASGIPGANDSLVDIRLHGDFERSILRLRHFGLRPGHDFNWHAALWSESIARLGKLFDSAVTGTATRERKAGGRQSEVFCEA